MSAARLIGYAVIAAGISLPALGLDSYYESNGTPRSQSVTAQETRVEVAAVPNALPPIVARKERPSVRKPAKADPRAMGYLVAGRVAESRGQDPDRIARTPEPARTAP